MSRRTGSRNPVNRDHAEGGPCHVYVLPCAWEDILKLGFSRNPLHRMQAMHPRWFEFFDLDRALLVETETVRDARDLELGLGHVFVLHNAPAPLVVRSSAGGHTEWYRGALESMVQAARTLAAGGYRVHEPLRPWIRRALLARSDLLYSWAQASLTPDELESPHWGTPNQRAVRDALDAWIALEIEIAPFLPDNVLCWHRATTRR